MWRLLLVILTVVCSLVYLLLYTSHVWFTQRDAAIVIAAFEESSDTATWRQFRSGSWTILYPTTLAVRTPTVGGDLFGFFGDEKHVIVSATPIEKRAEAARLQELSGAVDGNLLGAFLALQSEVTRRSFSDGDTQVLSKTIFLNSQQAALYVDRWHRGSTKTRWTVQVAFVKGDCLIVISTTLRDLARRSVELADYVAMVKSFQFEKSACQRNVRF